MSLKTVFAGTTVTAALVATTLSVSPVQAATISENSVLNLDSIGLFGGGVKRTGNTLDFFSFTNPINGTTSGQLTSVTASSGSFFNSNLASLVPPLPRIADLNLVSTSTPGILSIGGTVANFLTGIDIITGTLPSFPFVTTAPVAFDLTSFLYNSSTGDATLTGIFRSGTFSIAGNGRFTSQLELTPNVSSYSLSITAVPTPALLPGLVGMGIAAFRKRKSQSEQPEEAKA